MAAPVLNPPFISGIRNISDSNGNQLELQGLLIICTLGYNETTTPNGARFNVQFHVDNQLFYDWGDADSTQHLAGTSEGMLDGYSGRNVRKLIFAVDYNFITIMYFSKACLCACVCV